ncbi:DNA mismatch repair protein Mlh1p [Monosporozyma unispora]|nr:DNA mismatch repair protein [Kazachstania unispora]
MSEVGRIKALDVNVVNKIAAGEIIISPVNALKEMLENSIDAEATMIDVLVKDGGIKVLQISDNGSGINKGDLPILCERFTTSKLTSFEDLESIATYGFRGEALASISHIARVTVITKTKDDKCAWKVSFAEGKMTSEPKPVAGKDGTTILVEDLFYNIPSRLRALRSPNDEYNKILDVLGKYSIHSKGIGFTCKKFGTTNLSLTVKPNFTIQDRIRSIYGNSVSTSLIPFEVTGDLQGLTIDKVEGQITDLNFLSKKSTPPIFFINNRLVTCEPLRRSLQQVYQLYLPKGNRPFIYLDILIKPETVDVNVHPTKREVRFLNQDEIIDKISLDLQQRLMNLDTSRTYKASSLLTGSQPIGNVTSTKRDRGTTQTNESFMTFSTQNMNVAKNPFNASKIKKYDHNLIRTDSTQSKITTFLKSSQYVNEKSPTSNRTTNSQIQTTDSALNGNDSTEGNNKLSFTGSTTRVFEAGGEEQTDNVVKATEEDNDQDDVEVTRIENSSKLDSSFMADKPNDHKLRYVISPKQRVDINLTSIKQLREAVDDSTHRELTTIFANLTYVGVIDEERRLVAIQHDLKLFLVDYGSISYELFYQIGLTDFSNFGRIKLNSSNSDDLIVVNILNALDDIKLNIKEDIILKLWEMREMLEEYFSILITCDDADYSPDKIRINSIPLLLKGYNPPLSKLPYFLYRLGTKVNWEEERQCFDDILHQLALFYIPEIIPKKEFIKDATKDEVSPADLELIKKKEDMASTLEHVLFPCIKRRLLAPRKLLKDVVEIANLPGLYKVFERC